uniref:Uncharacterized protein n=1 Tax=Arundo donax TaxID=35708 RepID=A0A0A9BP06_ARUDO
MPCNTHMACPACTAPVHTPCGTFLETTLCQMHTFFGSSQHQQVHSSAR